MTDTRRIAVKPLEWEWPNEYGLVCRAVTPIGTYSVSDDEDRPSAMFCYLHLTDDGDCTRYAVKVVDDYLEPEEAQAAAQADYERRILSAITPAPEAGWRDVKNAPDWEGFGRALMEDWPTGDIDGSHLFDMSLKYGLIAEVPGGYNPDEHIDAEGICPETGDPWFEYAFGTQPATDPLEDMAEFDGQHMLVTEHPTEQPSVKEAARVLLEYLPNYAMENAALESRARDDEGEFASLSDLLDFSGQNKAYTVVREALTAALRSLAGDE